MFLVSLFLILDHAQKHRCEEQTNKSKKMAFYSNI